MNDSLQSKGADTDRPVLYSGLAYAGILVLGLVLIEAISFMHILRVLFFVPVAVTIQGNPVLGQVLFGIEVLIAVLLVALIALLPFFTGWFAARGTLRQTEQELFTTPGQSGATAGLCAAALGAVLASLVLLVVSFLTGAILEAFLFVILSVLASMLLGALGGYAYYRSYHRKQSHPPLTPPAMPAAA